MAKIKNLVLKQTNQQIKKKWGRNEKDAKKKKKKKKVKLKAIRMEENLARGVG